MANQKLEIHTPQKDRTIAVLPFVNMSSSQENEYFGDGITEEIINALAKIDGLRVTSRTSSFYFKGKNIPITTIGKELGVASILEGSVRIAGNTVRITAQLIDTAEDFHFWSETWDRQLDHIFEVQDEVSLLIAERLREHFGHFEIQEQLVEPNTRSLDAYKLFLRGRNLFNKWNPEQVKESMAYYQQVLEIDPNHAEAMVGLADAYSFLATIAVIPFEEGWTKCAELTQQAIEINDQLPSAHYQLAHLAFFTKWNYREAFEHTSKAIRLNPNHVDSQRLMAFLYILAGKSLEARAHLNIALSIDPLAEETQFYSGYIEYMVGHFNRAIEIFDACLEANPLNIPVHSVKTLCLIKLERFDEVVHYFDALPSEIVVPGEKAGTLALGYALMNDQPNADKHAEILDTLAKGENGFTADSYQFLLAAATAKKEEAFAWIEKALEEGSPLLLIRFSDPIVDPIKEDKRYIHFYKQLFPEALFGDKKEIRKKKALLDPKSTEYFKKQLLQVVSEEEPYLDPDLSLRSLAKRLDMHPNQLSWLLNNVFERNFNEFVNQYRVKSFQKMAKDPKNGHLTIMAIAYDCGFNSKSVFNTYFKKVTGTTPRQFLNG